MASKCVVSCYKRPFSGVFGCKQRLPAPESVNITRGVDGTTIKRIIIWGEGIKVGIEQYIVKSDKFEAPHSVAGFAFPCGACKHKNNTDSEEPCGSCGHNLNADISEADATQAPK